MFLKDLDTEEPPVEVEPFAIAGDSDLAAEDDEVAAHPGPDSKKDVSDDDEGAASTLISEARPLVGSDPAAAVAKLEDAVALDPRGTRAYALLAKANIKLKKPKAAIRDANAALVRMG